MAGALKGFEFACCAIAAAESPERRCDRKWAAPLTTGSGLRRPGLVVAEEEVKEFGLRWKAPWAVLLADLGGGCGGCLEGSLDDAVGFSCWWWLLTTGPDERPCFSDDCRSLQSKQRKPFFNQSSVSLKLGEWGPHLKLLRPTKSQILHLPLPLNRLA